jgi:hypothetical protein
MGATPTHSTNRSGPARRAGNLSLWRHGRRGVSGTPPREPVSTPPAALGRKAINSSDGYACQSDKYRRVSVASGCRCLEGRREDRRERRGSSSPARRLSLGRCRGDYRVLSRAGRPDSRKRHSMAPRGGFIKAMFFIFRYLCCKTEGRPRRREPRADGVTRARPRPGSRTIGSGDAAGRLFSLAQPTGTEFARTLEISDLRSQI